MSIGGYAGTALARIDILRSIVANKKAYFYRGTARYDDVLEGQFHLLPNEAGLSRLRRDFKQMQVMIFGDAPAFDEILKELARLEVLFNAKVPNDK